MGKSLILLSIVLVFLTGCTFTPVAQYSVTDQPKMEDIVGIYHFLVQRVVEDSKLENTSNSQIEILADGTCNFTDAPVFAYDTKFNLSYKGLFTGKCQWEATNQMGSVRRDGKSLSYWSICFNVINLDSGMPCAMLANDGSPYNLVFGFGNPDENLTLVFDKTPKK